MVIRQNLLHLWFERDQSKTLTGFAVAPPAITVDLDQQALLAAGWFAWSAGWWQRSGLSCEQIKLLLSPAWLVPRQLRTGHNTRGGEAIAEQLLLHSGHWQLSNSKALRRAQRSRLTGGLTDQQQQGPHPGCPIGQIGRAHV